jgi:hypothetical protein
MEWWNQGDEEGVALRQKALGILQATYNTEQEAGADGRFPHAKVFWERANALALWHEEHLPELQEINIHMKKRETWSTDHPDGSPAPFGSVGEFRRLAKNILSWVSSLDAWLREGGRGAWLPKIGSHEWDEFVEWMKSHQVQLLSSRWTPATAVQVTTSDRMNRQEFERKVVESFEVFKQEPDAGRRRMKALWDVWNTLQGGPVADIAVEEMKQMAKEDNPGGWMAKEFLESRGMVELS